MSTKALFSLHGAHMYHEDRKQEGALRLYRTKGGYFVEQGGQYYRIDRLDWDALVSQEDLHGTLSGLVAGLKPVTAFGAAAVLAPISKQEVWAAGVTYYR